MSAEKKLIYSAINSIMGKIGAVEKTRRNSAQNYSFRGIDDFYAVLQPLLVEHKVFFAPSVMDQQREERKSSGGGTLIYTRLTVKFTFYSAEDGSSLELITVGEGMDSGDKSSNKAMSAAAKYAIIPLFCVPTEEPKDSEYENPEPAPKDGGQNAGAPSAGPAPARPNRQTQRPQPAVRPNQGPAARPASNAPVQKLVGPMCPDCQTPTQLSSFVNKELGYKPWYCKPCKSARPELGRPPV